MRQIYLVLMSFTIGLPALAVLQVPPSQVYIIDSSKFNQQKKDSQYFQVDGVAVTDSDEPEGQLKMYVKNCGMLTIPKNSNKQAPTSGQKIHAILKESCKISDWN